MNTPQILTGQQAIDQYGLNALIECRVAVTTELNGLGHSVMVIGVIADPDSCQIDEDDHGVLWVEYQGADDWYLYSIPADEQFVLLDDKNNPPASNEVLANSIAELTRKNSELAAQVDSTGKDRDYERLHRLAAEGENSNLKEDIAYLAGQVEQLRTGFNQAIELLVTALHEPQQITESEIHELRTLEKQTPTQCLAARDADIKQKAIEPVLNKLKAAHGESTHPKAKTYLCEEALELCLVEINRINQLRQQAKGGE